LSKLYDYVTFDCYGTLIDWEGGIWAAFESVGAEAGIRLRRDATLEAYAEIEPIVQAATFMSYRDVLAETARRVARRFEWDLDEATSQFLPESLGSWRAFDDSGPALARLVGSGYRLGILSNVDADLLARTLRQFEVEFDLLITAQDVGSYKPAHGHFLAARDQIAGRRWLHAAQSLFHDVVPSRELGVPVAWINRKAETATREHAPDREFRDLTELAGWLAGD
jgi:2-haloalkanoic acid dehalogenase type II